MLYKSRLHKYLVELKPSTKEAETEIFMYNDFVWQVFGAFRITEEFRGWLTSQTDTRTKMQAMIDWVAVLEPDDLIQGGFNTHEVMHLMDVVDE